MGEKQHLPAENFYKKSTWRVAHFGSVFLDLDR